MKSLEIIDRKTMLYGDVILNTEEAEQIKQDLEVLEIIRKKKVNVLELKILQFGVWDNDMFLYLYNLNRCDEYKLTLEEILKLRQWLEVNKNA